MEWLSTGLFTVALLLIVFKAMEQVHHLNRFAGQLLPSIETKLERSGSSRTHARAFFRRQLIFFGAGTITGLIIYTFGAPFYIMPTLAISTYLWPTMRLNRVIRHRQRQIMMTFPYYLDLLSLSMEVGLDFVASCEEIASEDKPGAMRDEIFLTLKAIQMGTPRARAFQNLADRTGVEPLSLWASSIAQAEELGSSLAQLFRLQAEMTRREIFRDAEERAQRAPLKMLLPLVLFIFPVLFLLLFAPLGMRLFSMP